MMNPVELCAIDIDGIDGHASVLSTLRRLAHSDIQIETRARMKLSFDGQEDLSVSASLDRMSHIRQILFLPG